MSANQQKRLYIATRDLEKALQMPQADTNQLVAQLQALHYEIRTSLQTLQVKGMLTGARASA